MRIDRISLTWNLLGTVKLCICIKIAKRFFNELQILEWGRDETKKRYTESWKWEVRIAGENWINKL